MGMLICLSNLEMTVHFKTWCEKSVCNRSAFSIYVIEIKTVIVLAD